MEDTTTLPYPNLNIPPPISSPDTLGHDRCVVLCVPLHRILQGPLQVTEADIRAIIMCAQYDPTILPFLPQCSMIAPKTRHLPPAQAVPPRIGTQIQRQKPHQDMREFIQAQHSKTMGLNKSGHESLPDEPPQFAHSTVEYPDNEEDTPSPPAARLTVQDRLANYAKYEAPRTQSRPVPGRQRINMNK